MNAEELIESGKLELYVAGALQGMEAREVAMMVKANNKVQEEVRAIEGALLALLSSTSGVPSSSLKDKVAGAIQSPFVTRQNAIRGEEVYERKAIQVSSLTWLLAAACVALLVTFGVTAVLLNNKINEDQAVLTATKEEYKSTIIRSEKLAGELALINHQNTRKIFLSGVASSPGLKAIVYWNNLNGRVLISPLSLPAPPAGKQYQLWALLDGKPVSAGVFDVVDDADDKLQELKNIAGAQAFAVTLEESGGVLTPTLSATYVMGKL